MKKDDPKEIIMDLIVECLSSGKPLPSEKVLTEKLGVSRSRLRELLIEFEASGMIVATQGKGRIAQFPEVSNFILDGWSILLRARQESLLEFLEVRYILERGFLPSVIESLKLEDLQMLRDLVTRMEAKAKKNEVFKEEDQLFHRILYSRTKNIVLDQLLKTFWDLFEQTSEIHKSENLVESAELHKKLYEAILIQDSKEAEKLLEIQFNDVRERIKLMISQKEKEN